MDSENDPQHSIAIKYCSGCRWMLRATWLAQELLTTFDGDIDEVSLQPGSGGIFEIWLDGTRLWSRKDDGGFPEIKALKQLVRDRISPERSLGHSDASTNH
ncbi:selenoprotein W-related protein [Halospina denitrificans]|uniref:Selenoprotein W-related protein n=2 Tax=Halospina denitrificans TaxID=332522 RepID=A0A4R7JH02_9GAMM|nr:selenoprotein W-related protein [Halospina denitrificans]